MAIRSIPTDDKGDDDMTTTMKAALVSAAKAKMASIPTVVTGDVDFLETGAAPQGAVFATADMIRDEAGERILDIRFKVVGDLLTMTETGKNATQWAKIDIGGTNGWKIAMTLFVPASQLTPARFAKAVARRKAKLEKLAASVATKPARDMVD